MLRQAARTLDAINAVVAGCVALLLALATLAVFYQIVVRFVLPAVGLPTSAPWTEELARYSMAWAVFLGVGVICRTAGLIAVETLAHLAPRAIGRAIKYVSIAVTAGFFLALVIIGIDLTAMSLIETSPVMRVPMAWIYAAMPVGSALALLNLAVLVTECVSGERDVLAADPNLVVD